MAKKNRLLGALVLGAAAAGVYYYLKKKDSEVPENMDDDDDLDNFDEDVDDGPATKPEAKRSYVSLDINTVEKKVQEAVSKVADTADKAAATIGEKLQCAAGKVEEFFDDRKNQDDIPVDGGEESPADGGEPSEDDYVEEEETTGE